MKDVKITIRTATLADVPAIFEIYSYHVVYGLASWELSSPSPEEFQNRFKAIIKKGFPFFIAKMDGVVAGYTYANSYRPRQGYLYTVENSVYVHPEYQRRNLGYLLLNHLIKVCEDLGYRQMIAVIGDSGNISSIRLHKKSGFRHIGILPSIGFKHGRWIDSVLMQRPLGLGDQNLPQNDPLPAF